MRFFFLIIFLPFFVSAQSNQQMLQGLWVKAKAEMKDGSRIVDHRGCGMDFIKYNFGNDGFVDMSNDVLFDGFKVPCKLKGDSLIVGGTIYNVIGLTKDTLKLSFFAPGADDKQVPEYYFVKVPEYNVAAKATFDTTLKDSVYQATNELFPQCKSSMRALMGAIATRYDNGTLKASFIVDKKGRIKNFTILETDSVSKGFAKTVGNALGSLDWLPARKNNVPVNSIVQVTLKSANGVFQGISNMNTLNIEYPFLPKAPYPPLDRDEAEAERQYFKSALNQVNNGNNDKAIELLAKCIEIDRIDLNIYNLRALAYTNMGKNKEACKDWAILAGFGQIDAAKKLAKFCKN
jgi:hypothetical protein